MSLNVRNFQHFFFMCTLRCLALAFKDKAVETSSSIATLSLHWVGQCLKNSSPMQYVINNNPSQSGDPTFSHMHIATPLVFNKLI